MQSMVILGDYKHNYDTETTTGTSQWVLTSKQVNLVKYYNWYIMLCRDKNHNIINVFVTYKKGSQHFYYTCFELKI